MSRGVRVRFLALATASLGVLASEASAQHRRQPSAPTASKGPVTAPRATWIAGLRGMTFTISVVAGGHVEVITTMPTVAAGSSAPAEPPQRALFRAADVLAWAPGAAKAAQWYIGTKCRDWGDGSQLAPELLAVVPALDSATTEEQREEILRRARYPDLKFHCFADRETGELSASAYAGPYKGMHVSFASPRSFTTLVRAMRVTAERSATAASTSRTRTAPIDRLPAPTGGI